jgi:hypothetical protein
MSETQTQSAVVSNLDKFHAMKEVSFRFKKDKLGNQRPGIKMNLLVLTPDGVAQILTSGDQKQWSLLEDSIYSTVRDVLAGFVGEESFDPEKFDLSQLTWQAIANMPKEDRRSSSIPEELWTAFTADYIAVMPSLTGKTTKQVENATEVFVRKLLPVKSNKKVVEKLKEQLALYASQPSAESFTDILDLLLKRCDTYMAADDMTSIIGNL